MHKELIVITGASSGIGAGLAQVFSKAGYALALFARNLQALRALELPDVICSEVDVTDFPTLKKAIQAAEQKLGPVAGLINNAGVAANGPFTEIAHADYERMVAVNMMGVIQSIEVVLPMMQAQGRGTIINVSSLADRHTRPNTAVYAATKAAVKSLTESLRAAYAKQGIRFCNVAPAKIKTPMLERLNMQHQETIAVTDIAEVILWIYQQPQHVCIRDLVIAPTSYEA